MQVAIFCAVCLILHYGCKSYSDVLSDPHSETPLHPNLVVMHPQHVNFFCKCRFFTTLLLNTT